MTRALQDIELDLQSQDEAVVERALDDTEQHDLTNLEGRHGQTLMNLCMERVHSPSIRIRAGALSIILQLVRHGQYIPVGGLSSSKLARAKSARASRSRKVYTQTDVLAKKLQSPSALDLSIGEDQEHFERYHSNLCALITELQAQSPKKFLPGFKPIGHYLVKCTAHKNRQIATGACEYWAKLKVPPASGKVMDHWVPSVLSQLQTLIPALLNNMLYHDEQVAFLEAGNLGENATPKIEELSNLRNYSALGFENLCHLFKNEITAIFKPHLQKYLLKDSENWLRTEATVLALSAFTQAVGIPRELQGVYGQLQPKLLELYSHPQSLVRAITCFAMQQLVAHPMKGAKDPFVKVLKANMRLLTDQCPEVQVMALRSLSSMLATDGRDLTPYKSKLITKFLEASDTLKGDASTALYESIGYLFNQMGPFMNEEEVEQTLNPVLKHWQAMSLSEASSDDIIAICQPLCVIAMHAQNAFEAYNSTVLKKVCSFLQSVCTNGARNSHTEEELTTKLVSVIDLISSIYEGQGSGANASIGDTELAPLCMQLLKARDLENNVQQSVCAVLGHLSSHDYESVRPHFAQLMPILNKCINSRNSSLSNNALWALAQIAKHEENEKESFLALTDSLQEAVAQVDGDEGCVINAALALTTICAKWPEETAKVQVKLFPYICSLLQVQFPRDLERDAIFRNLCNMLESTMDRIHVNGWDMFCTAAALLSTNDRQLMEQIAAFIRNLRQQLGNKGWNAVSQQIGPQLAIALRKRYKLY